MKGFEKFRKKFQSRALIKSAIFGVSCGLIAYGVLFLLVKREWIGLNLLFCVLIGVGVALLFGGSAYFLLRPNDKKLAKRLDKEFGLHEKVQTMVAFKDDKQVMTALQRADAEERLNAIPVPALTFKKIWKYAALSVLSLATFAASLIVPAKLPVEAVDPEFNLSEWQKLRLENLIEDVKNSEMIAEARTYTVGQLENLIVYLDSAEKESVMKTHVIKTIVNVDDKTDKINSYGAIHTAIGKSGEDALTEFAKVLENLQKSASVQAFEEFRAVFTYETFKSTAASFNAAVEEALSASGYGATDALYASVHYFTVALETLSDGFDEHTETTFDAALNGENGVGGLYTEFAAAAHGALSQQKKNRRTCDYVIAELMDVFKIAPSELPDLGEEELNYQPSDDEKENDDKSPEDGGMGTGDTVYGSDDVIFDPERGYVEYGEVLNEYNAKMLEQLFNGSLPEDVQEYIRAYFAALYNGNKAEAE